MKIAFLTLGCKLNYAETSTYERGFLQAGWEVVSWQEKADVYLINTCSVTATSDSKSRNLIRKVHRVNSLAYIIVTGCSAQLRRTEIEGIDGVSRVFGAHEKQNVVSETLDAVGSGHGFRATDAAGSDGVFGAFSTGERTRSFLKVQDGCSNYCAYCTVPYARGESRNIPIAECVAGARAIAAEGVKEVVLTGVNTGDFGKTTGESFLDLLKALNGVDGIERYRISSIEPNLLTEEIIAWIASGTKFQPHFHIPLQSGSDEILKAMGRHYDTAAFYDKIQLVRRYMEAPGRLKVFFGIDLMTGLPGEADALFRESCDFIKKVTPAFIHVFPYSRRPGTPAASMPGQLSEEVKKERVAILEDLCAQLHGDFVDEHQGMHARVLFESKEKDGSMGGYTENYIRVTRPYDASLSGEIVDVVI
jgi:threonylcarbamoyladenosine tRNA methylthiotransferase MtaB